MLRLILLLPATPLWAIGRSQMFSIHLLLFSHVPGVTYLFHVCLYVATPGVPWSSFLLLLHVLISNSSSPDYYDDTFSLSQLGRCTLSKARRKSSRDKISNAPNLLDRLYTITGS